jgi:surface antigen
MIMIGRTSLVLMAAALMASTAVDSVSAQPRGRPNNPQYRAGYEEGYREAYRQAYRQGYRDARENRRFDDSDYSYGYGYDDNDYNNNDPRYQRWRTRYRQTYTYTDDNFYQECRTSVDPGGVIAGALIGGLLGNAIGSGGGRTGATVAGVIVGGAAGAALTRDVSCEDRSYAYKTYYDGFNAGRPNAVYQWRNPRSNNSGTFRVADYYNDPDGFRCANYTQQIFINGRPQAASGRACQQPDGTWAIVN